MVEHLDFPDEKVRGIIQQVTSYRRNGIPRKAKVLWFPRSVPSNNWLVRTLMASDDAVSIMKLNLISPASRGDE